MAILIFFIIHWYFSLFFQTFFDHRYAAHRMFTMSKGWEKVFYVLAFIFQGSSYLSPYAYGVMHRMHHAFADTEKDPHSPQYDDNLFKMMWRSRLVFNDIYYHRATIEPRFLKDLPEWISFDRFASSRPVRIAWGHHLCTVLFKICDCLVDVFAHSCPCHHGPCPWRDHQLVCPQIRLYQF